MTIKSWKRRGEWLELMPGKAVTGSSDKPMAAEQWLLSELQFPEKLLRQLKANRGIQLAGDRLRLALFASQPIDVEPRWADVDVLYEDDFCLVMHKPAGMKLHPDGSRADQAITLDHVVASYYEMNGIQASVRHVHRLDEDTTGPVLYAKNTFALAKLDEAMRRKEIGRHYVAIAGGQIPLNSAKLMLQLARIGIINSVDVSPKVDRKLLLMWRSPKYGNEQPLYD